MVPEELVPVQLIGKMVLDKNPDNFFAETEQVAFHPGHLVPGIDFTNDPLLQGRLFSYTDTQLSRLGSPNFHEIPINRPINSMHNNQRDGHMRQEINKGRVSYHPNSLGGGCPYQAKIEEGGFHSFNERIDAQKVRERSESFSDHFSQATLFYNSMTKVEQNHIVKALRFELGKVETVAIRNRMLGLLSIVDKTLAEKVAQGLGLKVPKPEKPMNEGVGANPDPKQESVIKKPTIDKSSALTMIDNPNNSKTIATRQIAFLCSAGVDDNSVNEMKKTLEKEGAMVKIIGPHLGVIKSSANKEIEVDQSFLIASSVLFDAVYVPQNKNDFGDSNNEAIDFINESYIHCKPIAIDNPKQSVIPKTKIDFKAKQNADMGIILKSELENKTTSTFIKAIGQHRFWNREEEL